MAQTKIANNQLQLDVSKNYTQDNLVAGNSIEIAERVNPYVIDEHTVALWHFDGSLVDEISGNSITITNASFNELSNQSKFPINAPKSLYLANNQKSSDDTSYSLSTPITLTRNWTIDFWGYIQSGHIIFNKNQNNTGNPTNYIDITTSSSHSKCNFGGAAQSLAVAPGDNQMHHFAFCIDTNANLYYFIDGILKTTYDFSSYLNSFTINYLSWQTSGYTTLTIDELRISNVCRWTENFEVPDAPYEAASGSNPMAINTIVDTALSSTSKNPVQNKVINTALNGKQAALTTATGYDATKTQVLKNINGVLTWVDEA